MPDYVKLANDLDDYMKLRARKEKLEYELSPDFFLLHLREDIRSFFGVECDDARMLRDTQFPHLFKEWQATRPEGPEASGEDLETAAFLLAGDKIREAIKDIDAHDACLALTMALAECVVFGNSEDDEPDEAMRLAHAVRLLGDVAMDMMSGDYDQDDDSDGDSRPPPPSADPLRRLLERRKASKAA
jgi:hypothetical protein